MPAPPGPGQPGYKPPYRTGNPGLDSGGSIGDGGREQVKDWQGGQPGRRRPAYDPDGYGKMIRHRIRLLGLVTWGLLAWLAVSAAVAAWGPVPASARPAGAVFCVLLFLLILGCARGIRREKQQLRQVRGPSDHPGVIRAPWA
jgi:hypothetical protein